MKYNHYERMNSDDYDEVIFALEDVKSLLEGHRMWGDAHDIGLMIDDYRPRMRAAEEAEAQAYTEMIREETAMSYRY